MIFERLDFPDEFDNKYRYPCDLTSLTCNTPELYFDVDY